MSWPNTFHGDSTSICSSCRFSRVAELIQYCAGIFEVDATGVGQLDTARFAAEQLHVEFAFQRLDLLAERRLLHAKPFSGARDVPFLSDRNEISEVPEFHYHIH